MAAAMIGAKMTVETSDGLVYTFPNVELAVTTDVREGDKHDSGWLRYSSPDILESLNIKGRAFRTKDEDYIMMTTKRSNVATCKVPELYSDDLNAIKRLIGALEVIVEEIPELFSVEIRVRFDDTKQWAVVGYGELGDPCVLRFETDNDES